MRPLRGSPFYSTQREYYTKENHIMAKFKCKHTGNIVEFTTQHDIDTMRKHQEYEEVVEQVEEEPVVKKTKAKAE